MSGKISARTDTGKFTKTFTMTGSAVDLKQDIGNEKNRCPRQVIFWTSDDYELVFPGAQTDTVPVIAPYTINVAVSTCSATSGVKVTCVY